MHKIENMPLQPSVIFSCPRQIKPICLFFQENPLCSYIRIGNHVRVKSPAGSKSRVLPADPFFTQYHLNESGKNYFDSHFLIIRSS